MTPVPLHKPQCTPQVPKSSPSEPTGSGTMTPVLLHTPTPPQPLQGAALPPPVRRMTSLLPHPYGRTHLVGQDDVADLKQPHGQRRVLVGAQRLERRRKQRRAAHLSTHAHARRAPSADDGNVASPPGGRVPDARTRRQALRCRGLGWEAGRVGVTTTGGQAPHLELCRGGVANLDGLAGLALAAPELRKVLRLGQQGPERTHTHAHARRHARRHARGRVQREMRVRTPFRPDSSPRQRSAETLYDGTGSITVLTR